MSERLPDLVIDGVGEEAHCGWHSPYAGRPKLLRKVGEEKPTVGGTLPMQVGLGC